MLKTRFCKMQDAYEAAVTFVACFMALHFFSLWMALFIYCLRILIQPDRFRTTVQSMSTALLTFVSGAQTFRGIEACRSTKPTARQSPNLKCIKPRTSIGAVLNTHTSDPNMQEAGTKTQKHENGVAQDVDAWELARDVMFLASHGAATLAATAVRAIVISAQTMHAVRNEG